MQESHRILVVDDEVDLAELLAYNLGKAGFDVVVAHTGTDALREVARRAPDLILLDVMMPGKSGTEVAAELRGNEETAQIPIIMLTARTEESDEVDGLASGADDYITKPFSMRVVQARIEVAIRRANGGEGQAKKKLSLGPIEIDLETHQARVDGEEILLTVTEFRLLAALISVDGKVLSRPALISRAIGPGVTVTERTIDVHVTSIRKKLGKYGDIILTVRGVGYRATLELSQAANR